MGIARVEEARFGVTDIEECVRFFRDFGLEELESGAHGATFATPAGQRLELREAHDPALPAPLEAAPTIREVVWGVNDDASLATLAEELSSDRDVEVDSDGVVRTHDHTGFALGLRVAQVKPVDPGEPRRANVTGSVQRWNQPITPYRRAHPLRICHVALNIPADGWEESVAFYVNRLRFRITDQLLDMGTFMQCEEDIEQHTLLLSHRPNRAGINHVAYEVRNFDEVAEGGNHMVACGWKEARRLGRHTIGSNVFRFFHAPCGGRVEYAADMDRVDAAYGPNVYEQRPPHHLWILTSSGQKGEEQ